MGYSRYEIPRFDWPDVAKLVVDAEDNLARLDERISKSTIREGWISRFHFLETQAITRIEGELIQLEDLVLHDAHMDARTPTAQLLSAHSVLRNRRRLARLMPLKLSLDLVDELRGRGPNSVGSGDADTIFDDEDFTPDDDPLLEPADDEIARMLSASSALAERAARALLRSQDRGSYLVYDEDWDEEGRLADWLAVCDRATELPTALAAVIVSDAWNVIEPLQRAPGFASLVCATALTPKMSSVLTPVGLGMASISPAERNSGSPMRRYEAGIRGLIASAKIGLEKHETWMAAKALLDRKLIGHRRNSRLPQLVDLLLAKPLVSSGIIASELDVSVRAAQNLIAELGVREVTGRGRFRAWSLM